MSDSPFDVNYQNRSIDAKIIAGLERMAEVFRVLLWQQSRQTGLSPLQIQVMLFLAFHEPKQCKIGYLAKEFNVTKPTMSDAIKVLYQKKLVERIAHLTDSRSHHLQVTPAGQQIVEQTSHFSSVLQSFIQGLDPHLKTGLYEGLFKLIHELTQAGLLTIQRMCSTCIHYQLNQQVHYCGLLRIPLESDHLRLDCPEHEARAEV